MKKRKIVTSVTKNFNRHDLKSNFRSHKMTALFNFISYFVLQFLLYRKLRFKIIRHTCIFCHLHPSPNNTEHDNMNDQTIILTKDTMYIKAIRKKNSLASFTLSSMAKVNTPLALIIHDCSMTQVCKRILTYIDYQFVYVFFRNYSTKKKSKLQRSI